MTDSVRERLDEELDSFDYDAFLDKDPLGLVRGYESQIDQEAAGLLASCLAYGRRSTFISKIEDLLGILGRTPGKKLKSNYKDPARRIPDDFKYRFTEAPDIRDLFAALSYCFNKYGTLENTYRAMSGDSHLDRASRFISELRSNGIRNGRDDGYQYLLPDPADGSACKRLHLFFRWVSRGKAPDLALWEEPAASDLIIPLDTHVHSAALELDLIDRKTADLKAAQQITGELLEIDPVDPVKYDLALMSIGEDL